MNRMEQQDIELQIWDYIDGNCGEEAKTYIAGMIATDAAWADTYQQLMALHTTLPGQGDMDQPSMRFSKNVMEAIAHTSVARPTRRYVNPFVIKAISAFFILSFIAVLSYALYHADSQTDTISFPQLNVAQILNSSLFHIIAWINVVLGLLAVDMFLRKGRMHPGRTRKA